MSLDTLYVLSDSKNFALIMAWSHGQFLYHAPSQTPIIIINLEAVYEQKHGICLSLANFS